MMMLGVIIALSSIYPFVGSGSSSVAEDHRILDSCTPYSMNGENNFTAPLLSMNITSGKIISINHTNPCNRAIMLVKFDCDRNTFNILTTSNICSDPRYQDWLVHDFNAIAWRIYNGETK